MDRRRARRRRGARRGDLPAALLGAGADGGPRAHARRRLQSTCDGPLETPQHPFRKEHPMLRVAVPNKGALSESAAEILSEAGYRRRTDSRDLTVLDPANHVEFFFLRPKDIAIYVGIRRSRPRHHRPRPRASTLAPRSPSGVALGFGRSTFRYAAPAGKDWKVEDLAGLRIATSYPNLVRADLAARGIEADGDPPRRRRRDLDPARRRRRDRRRRRLGPHAARSTTWWRSASRCAIPRACSSSAPARTARRPDPQPADRPHPGCRVRAAVPDARLRLPA